jgi:hypothetical protein
MAGQHTSTPRNAFLVSNVLAIRATHFHHADDCLTKEPQGATTALLYASGWNDRDTGESIGLMTYVNIAICGTNSDRQGV